MGKLTKILLVAALAMLVIIPRAKAQSPFYLGIKGGISVPNLSAGGSASAVSTGYSSILGPYFGVFADIKIARRWSLQPELNYSAQGGQKNGVQAIPTSQFANYFPPGYTPPAYFYATFDSKARLNYLELPILVKYKVPLGKKWKFLIDAGPYVGYLLVAKNITKDSSNVYYDEAETQVLPVGKQNFAANQSITDDIHRFNFGIQGGIGLQWEECKMGYFYLQAGGNYGLLNIQKYAVDGKNQTGAATLAVGYAFRLK
jgi:hypothetical protein